MDVDSANNIVMAIYTTDTAISPNANHVVRFYNEDVTTRILTLGWETHIPNTSQQMHVYFTPQETGVGGDAYLILIVAAIMPDISSPSDYYWTFTYFDPNGA